MTLNGVIALILRYFTEFGSVRSAVRKSGWRYRRKKVDVRYLISWWVSCNNFALGLGGGRSIAIFVSVCMSVCLSVRPLACLKNHMLHKFSVHVTCGRSSVFLWRQWRTLCTSGFVDDVIFSHNGPHRVWRWQYRRASHAHKFPTYWLGGAVLFDFVLIHSGRKLRTGAKFAIYDCFASESSVHAPKSWRRASIIYHRKPKLKKPTRKPSLEVVPTVLAQRTRKSCFYVAL